VTGADEVFDAALRQMGIIRVDDTNELYEAAMLLRRGRRPGGRRASAASVSGGNLVMAADLGASLGIEWPQYSQATQKRLSELLPGFSAVTNPTDLTSVAIGRKDAFASVCRTMAEDEQIDVVIPVLTMSSAEEIRSVGAFSAAAEKPVAILWTGGAIDEPALTPEVLVSEGHAVYRDAIPCLKAVRASMRYGEFRRRLGRPAPQRPTGIDVDGAKKLLSNSKGTLTEQQSKLLLAH
jgi:acetyltransferase